MTAKIRMSRSVIICTHLDASFRGSGPALRPGAVKDNGENIGGRVDISLGVGGEDGVELSIELVDGFSGGVHR